ncbi:unnamed protein product [Pylaiella littoralis]
MPRPLCSAVLLLALSWPVFSTPEIPSAFFEAQQQQQQQRQPGADPSALRQVHYEESFRAWMAEHGIVFRTREDFGDRLRIFADNSEFIEKHNAAGDGSTFTLGHNEFSHLTWAEFKESHLGYQRPGRAPAPAQRRPGKPWAPAAEKVAASRRRLVAESEYNLPSEVDWVEDGAVTPVQNQGMCGSCWAFSAIGAMEGAYYMSTNELTKFSEEQLVDCDKVDKGCFGGDMGQAYDWIKENGGVCTEEEYPYAGLWPPFKTCATACTPVEGTEVKEWTQVEATDEALMAALAKVGPIAIAIEADQTAFQFYKDGVFTAPCGDQLDHGVLAVGYGTWEDGTDYWKVKNSWGETWGQDGYILLERADTAESSGGECGLLIEATYPVLTDASSAFEDTLADLANEAVRLSQIAMAKWVERPAGFESSASAVDCGGGASDVVFDDVSVTPASPQRGKPISMKAKGTLTKPLPEASYDLQVKLGSAVVFQHTGSVCGDTSVTMPLGLGKIDIHGLPCPASPGPVEFAVDLTLPPIAPPGDYDINLAASEVTGADNSNIIGNAGSSPPTALCLDVKLEL